MIFYQTLSVSQVKELRQAFEEIDRFVFFILLNKKKLLIFDYNIAEKIHFKRDGSGYLSRRELRQAFRYLDIRASDDEMDIILNQMDTNGKLMRMNRFI